MPRKAAAAKPGPVDFLDHAPPEARLIPLDQLYLHPLNPRQEPPAAEIEALAQSIAALGLIQNLSGFADHQIRFRDGFPDANPKHTGIVAGGRRLRALQLLAARGEWQGPVPVLVTTDAAIAAQWAGAENETQRELPVPDRITAYATMRRAGHSADAIASAFGTPLSDVRRLLALATLPDQALEALRNGRIGLDIAKLLTSAPTAQLQDAALRAALEPGARDWTIREMLRKGTVTSTDRRAVYVGLAAYHDAGGSFTLDLFAEATILHDEGLLDRLALEKATTETEDLRAAEGWAWAEFAQGDVWRVIGGLRPVHRQPVELLEGDAARMDELAELDELTDAEEAELVALEARCEARIYAPAYIATAGIVTKLNHLGELVIEGAYRRPGDRPAQAGTGDDSIDISPAAPEAAMPQNLKDDLRRIRLICIQDALRERPALMLDMLGLQLTRRLRPWEQPFALDQTHAIPPEKRDGMTIPAALAEPDRSDAERHDAEVTLQDWMRADARSVIDPALHHGLARAFCRTDGPFVDLIHARNPVTPRGLWHPTAEGFLKRVSAAYLDALWRELVPDDGSRHAGFALSPKKEKVYELDQLFNGHELREALGLTRNQNARIDAWLPEELRFGSPEATEE